MAQRLLSLIALTGLAVALAACSGAATPTPLPSPSPTPMATPAAAPTESATPTVPTAAPSLSAVDAYPFLSGYQGTFNGSWNDTTFATTGSMTWIMSADSTARTVTIDVTVGGKFFGGPGAPGETILLSHLATGTIHGTSRAFGSISGTITPDGKLTITLSQIPGGVIKQVDVTGTFSGGDTISIDYSVTFVAGGAKASGKVELVKS